MNILTVTGKFHGSGGTETFVRNMSRGLIERGHTVTVISHQKFSERRRNLTADGLNVYYTFPSFHIPRIPMSYLLPYVIAKCLRISMSATQNYDIIHAQGELEGFCALQVKSLHRAPVALRIAGIWHSIALKEIIKIYGDNWLTRSVGRIMEIMEKEVLRSSDAISTLNEQQKEVIVDKYGAQPEKVDVIPHGVDTDVFSPQTISKYRDSMRKFCHLEGPVILYIARLTPIKRIDLLLEALSIIVKDIPALKLVLIGPRGYRDINYYMAQARLLGVDGNLVYLGEMPHQEIAKYMAVCDVYADVSQEYGIGFSTLEAMSCGLPVVSTRPEEGILKVNQSAESIAEGLITVLTDRRKARNLGEKARNHIMKVHDLKKVVDSYIEFFQDTLNRRRHAEDF